MCVINETNVCPRTNATLPTGLRTTAVCAYSMDIIESIVDGAENHTPGGCSIAFLWTAHAL
jgi:hypothetical protein